MVRTMRQSTWFLVFVFFTSPIARATWSIVLVDGQTHEVALGTATCVTGLDLLGVLPVIVVEKGAAAVQASGDFDGTRRPVIFQGFLNGDAPDEILVLLAGIAGHQSRQYGIVDVLGRKTTFSGSSTLQWSGGVTGSLGNLHYAIQGNILTGACVVADIEQAILNTVGDIPEKLMAAMEVARLAGGDGRCSCSAGAPMSCGCPVAAVDKAGHIGGLIVARPGDSDDPNCDVNGCADGDYFMRLNVAFQNNINPDPVLQLRSLFDDWRNGLIGRPDAARSMVGFDPPAIPPNGQSVTTMRLTLLDWQDNPVTASIQSVNVSHAPDSAGLATIGAVVINPDGTADVSLTAGHGVGTDQFVVDVDDGVRSVRLMPEPVLTFTELGDVNVDGVINVTDLVLLINGEGPCPAPPVTCLEDLTGDGVVDDQDLFAAYPLSL